MGDLSGTDYNIVCDNCGLAESQHTFGIGTRVMINKRFVCDGYSQKKLWTRKQWEKDHKADEDENAKPNQLSIIQNVNIA